jgi:hypothetical protein
MSIGEVIGHFRQELGMAHSTSLGDLDDEAVARNALPTQDRLQALIRTVAHDRQRRRGPQVYGVRAEVRTVFEEVLWGVKQVARRVDLLKQPSSEVRHREIQHEIDQEYQWLLGRLEVLHGLVDRLSF